MNKYILTLFLALLVASFFLGRYTKAGVEITTRDTITIARIDTIRLTTFKPYKVIVKDTIRVEATDTLRINDTLFINLPREQ